MSSSRRRFLLTASALSLGGALPWSRYAVATDEEGESRKPAELPSIVLGRTGRTVPRVGLGTAILARLESEDLGVQVIRRAIDAGVRYLDTAPSYSRGKAEQRIALALDSRERADFFIATKTLERSGDDARRDLERSLKRLKTDYVDSIQVHAVHKDVESLFGPKAVLKGLEKAKAEGLVRHIGITGHANPAPLIDAIRRYEFDTALVPVNPIDTKHLSFTRDFLPVAKERNVAVIAMKVLADGALLRSGRITAGELLRYALSQEHVAVAVPGCDALEHVDVDVAALRNFKPMPAEKQRELEQRAGEHKGRDSEWYKEERD